MTALLVTHVFPPLPGGSGRWFWEIYRRLPREQVAIVAGEHLRSAEFDLGHDLRVNRVPMNLPSWGIRSLGGIKGYWRALREIRRIVKRDRITQLHCGACLPDGWLGYLCRRFFGVPYLVYMHGEELCYAGSSHELGWMCRKVLLAAEFIVANSQNTRTILLEKWGVPENKIQVLTPGVDCERFHPREPDAELRRDLGWQDRLVILTVGRLQKRKGHDALIRALPLVREHVPQVLYSIAGGGEERERLEKLVAELDLRGFVQFRGETTDEELIACYQQCDLFALPNRRIGEDLEGFGMVLVEAQACGKPVIAGNSGGTGETMRIPDTGLTLNCDETARLSECLSGLLLDSKTRLKMGQSVRAMGQRTFRLARSHGTSVRFAPGQLGRDSSYKFHCPRGFVAVGMSSHVKSNLKAMVNGISTLLVLPCVVLFRLGSFCLGKETCFPGWSQVFSLIPGICGVYLRRAFFGWVLPGVGKDAWISFGTVFSHPTAEIGERVYVGVGCMIGDVTLEQDVLIGSHVSIINGNRQHGIERLDVPVREQPGEYPRVTIGQDSWIGDRSIVMANVGRHAVVGAGSVVTKPIPDFAIVVGNPAKVIKLRNDKPADTSAQLCNQIQC